jgi:hypothetical protein
LLCIGAFLFSETKTSTELGLTCSFSVGNSWIIKKTDNGEIIPVKFEENSTLSYNSSLHTKDNSLCELINNSFLIRLGANSIFEFNELNEFSLLRGSMLLYSLGTSDIIIESEQSSLNVSGKFTAIIDHTSNGGFKFIPLEGKGSIIPQNGEPKDIYRGRLTMILGSPSKLGNAYDIDLLLLLKSSRLINSFPTPLPSMKRISLSIYAQQLQLKGKFNALIGDATSEDNLQMWAFGEDESK